MHYLLKLVLKKYAQHNDWIFWESEKANSAPALEREMERLSEEKYRRQNMFYSKVNNEGQR